MLRAVSPSPRKRGEGRRVPAAARRSAEDMPPYVIFIGIAPRKSCLPISTPQ
jgi:hypothetical protein